MINFPLTWKSEINSRYLGTGSVEVEFESSMPVIHDGIKTGGERVMSARFRGSINVESLGADKTLSILDEVIQILDPNGSDRNVLLPGPDGDYYKKIKNSGGANDLIIKQDATTVATLTPGQVKEFYSDQTNWIEL